MGVSKNRGTPKWMVYNGKPYLNGWFGGTTIFGNPVCSYIYHIFYIFPVLLACKAKSNAMILMILKFHTKPHLCWITSVRIQQQESAIRKNFLLIFFCLKISKTKKRGKTYRYKNMFEGHMCFFKSPIITTKIGGFGRAPLSPPNPTSHPTSHPTVSNRLQPSPSPNTWHRNGTTAEALALVLFRFTTSRPEIWSTTNDSTLRGEIESMFWFVVVLVKPPTSWKSEDFIYNTICICIDMFLFV